MALEVVSRNLRSARTHAESRAMLPFLAEEEEEEEEEAEDWVVESSGTTHFPCSPIFH